MRKSSLAITWARIRSQLKRLRPEPLSVTQHPVKFSDHTSCESEDFSNYHVNSRWSDYQKGHMVSMVGASHGKSAACLVWCPWVFWNRWYNLFTLSRDFTRPSHWEVMQIYGWELLIVYHHSGKLCDHRHCVSGDIMFLIYHVTSLEYMLKWLSEFIGWSLLR